MSQGVGDTKLTQLKFYYEKLTKLLDDESVDPQLIEEVIKEVDLIFQELIKQGEITHDKLTLMNELDLKAKLLIVKLQDELNKMNESLTSLNSGKKAVNAYQPQPTSLGYSEGKFVDLKK